MRWSAGALGRARSCRMHNTGEREKESVRAGPLGTCVDATYVRKARVGEGPGESPTARVTLDELCECVIRYL
jgi:hypothetical protein